MPTKKAHLTVGFGARNGVRTRDIQLGKLTLYQLSYSRRARRPYGKHGALVKGLSRVLLVVGSTRHAVVVCPGRAWDAGLRGGREAVHEQFREGACELLLARRVRVERAAGDPRFPRDVFHTRLPHATRAEQGARAFEDARTRRALFRRHRGVTPRKHLERGTHVCRVLWAGGGAGRRWAAWPSRTAMRARPACNKPRMPKPTGRCTSCWGRAPRSAGETPRAGEAGGTRMERHMQRAITFARTPDDARRACMGATRAGACRRVFPENARHGHGAALFAAFAMCGAEKKTHGLHFCACSQGHCPL